MHKFIMTINIKHLLFTAASQHLLVLGGRGGRRAVHRRRLS